MWKKGDKAWLGDARIVILVAGSFGALVKVIQGSEAGSLKRVKWVDVRKHPPVGKPEPKAWDGCPGCGYRGWLRGVKCPNCDERYD